MGRFGFSLLELLVVVAVVAILAAVAVPNFLNARLRSDIAKAVEEMRCIGDAVENYCIDRGIYPPWKNANGSSRNHPGFSARLYPLTTPVGYLTSVPRDPFAQGWAERLDPDLQHPAYDTYHYVDARSTVYYPVPRLDLVLGVSFRCSEWSVVSAGPNGLMTFGGGPSFTLSNGLRSGGDLIRVGPRTTFACDASLVGK